MGTYSIKIVINPYKYWILAVPKGAPKGAPMYPASNVPKLFTFGTLKYFGHTHILTKSFRILFVPRMDRTAVYLCFSASLLDAS